MCDRSTCADRTQLPADAPCAPTGNGVGVDRDGPPSLEDADAPRKMAEPGCKRPLEREENNEFSPQVKRLKVEGDHGGGGGGGGGFQPVFPHCMSGFQMSKVLSVNAREKKIIITGKFANQDAVVTLEKTPFTEDTVAEIFNGSTLRPDMSNYIYGTYHLQPPLHLNEIKTTVVCPASKKNVSKYNRNESFLVEETRIDYEAITQPYIEKQRTFSLQWINNILQKKAETDRIVYEDPDPDTGFILLPDFKWDQKQKDDLYLIAIVRHMCIRSLRDLTAQHIPLLMNIFRKGQIAIMERYCIPATKLRVYVHYQPSFYHLHVHFTNLGYDAPGSGVERSHLLSDVIQNLQCDPAYYKTRTMYFPLREGHKLLNRFKEAGRV